MSSTAKTNPVDAKREEFRKYLEKEGILEALTKSLVQLYEEPQKPTSALDYLKNNFSNKETLETEINTLREEVTVLKKRNQELVDQNGSLEKKVQDLEAKLRETAEKASSTPAALASPKQPDNNTTESSSEVEMQDPAPEEQGASEFVDQQPTGESATEKSQEPENPSDESTKAPEETSEVEKTTESEVSKEETTLEETPSTEHESAPAQAPTTDESSLTKEATPDPTVPAESVEQMETS